MCVGFLSLETFPFNWMGQQYARLLIILVNVGILLAFTRWDQSKSRTFDFSHFVFLHVGNICLIVAQFVDNASWNVSEREHNKEITLQIWVHFEGQTFIFLPKCQWNKCTQNAFSQFFAGENGQKLILPSKSNQAEERFI